MFIRIPKETFELGDAVPAEIIFVNTSKAPMVLKDNPEKSRDLVMHAVHRPTGEDFTYAIGKITATSFGSDKFALTVPPRKAFELGPDSLLSFTTDLNDRLYLSPGKYDCRLVYYTVESSNPVGISIAFTAASFLHLLKTAADGRQSYGRREWAYDWLKRAAPDLELKLVLDDEAEDRKREKTEFNDGAYARWKLWWEENQGNEEFLARIRGLNP